MGGGLGVAVGWAAATRTCFMFVYRKILNMHTFTKVLVGLQINLHDAHSVYPFGDVYTLHRHFVYVVYCM